MTTTIHPTTGVALRLQRQCAGLTIAQLATSTGLSPGHLSKVERGRRRASVTVTVKVCAATAKSYR